METEAVTPETETPKSDHPAPTPATASMLDVVLATEPPKPPQFRLIARESRRFEFPLTLEERARIGDRVGNLGRRLRELEREHEAESDAAKARIAAAKSKAAEAAAERRTEIKEAAEEFDTALEAQTTGMERRAVDVERRAVIATATIEVVRLDTGEVVDVHPMSDADRAKWCQGDIADVTGGLTIKAGSTESDEPDTAAHDDDTTSDTITDDEADELGLPRGWPRAWRDREWKVGDTMLTEGDVREVYIRLADAGTTIDELLDGREGVAAMDWLDRKRVGRALALLKQKALVGKLVIAGQPPAWAPTAALAEVLEVAPEPGRTDPLPEAADGPKPKRQGKRVTKADKLVNAAAEQSDGWAL